MGGCNDDTDTDSVGHSAWTIGDWSHRCAIRALAADWEAVKAVEFKIFTPNHRGFQRRRFLAPEGTEYTDVGAEAIADSLVHFLCGSFPLVKFRKVSLGRGKFNIVHEVGEA
jgi:hypothetical protein